MVKFITRAKLFWTFTEYEYENIVDACAQFATVCRIAERDAEDGYCNPCVSLIERKVDSNGMTHDIIHFEKRY